MKQNLTLTSVVFELKVLLNNSYGGKNLTLTSVVFELRKSHSTIICWCYLTLTSVVFEYHFRHLPTIKITKFNFNKCCI